MQAGLGPRMLPNQHFALILGDPRVSPGSVKSTNPGASLQNPCMSAGSAGMQGFLKDSPESLFCADLGVDPGICQDQRKALIKGCPRTCARWRCQPAWVLGHPTISTLCLGAPQCFVLVLGSPLAEYPRSVQSTDSGVSLGNPCMPAYPAILRKPLHANYPVKVRLCWLKEAVAEGWREWRRVKWVCFGVGRRTRILSRGISTLGLKFIN